MLGAWPFSNSGKETRLVAKENYVSSKENKKR